MNNNGATVVIKKGTRSIGEGDSAGTMFEVCHTVVVSHKVWKITHVERMILIWVGHAVRTRIEVPSAAPKLGSHIPFSWMWHPWTEPGSSPETSIVTKTVGTTPSLICTIST